MTFRVLWRSHVFRLAASICLIIVIGMISAVMLIRQATSDLDARSRDREIQMIASALDAHTKFLEKMVSSHASAPRTSFSSNPADSESLRNLLQSDLSIFGIDGAIYVDGDATVTEAIGRGGVPMSMDRARRMLQPIIADISEMSRIMPIISGIVLWEGIPSVMVAVPRVPEPAASGAVVSMARPLLIYFDQIDASLLTGLARQHALAGLRLGAPSSDEAFIPVNDLAGTLLTSVVWDPYRPGQVLQRDILAPLLIIFALLAFTCLSVILFARHATNLIRASELRALLDPLTGLPNRFLLEDRLQRVLLAMHRNRESLTLLYLDLDGFKQVNDSAGHAAGDELLRQAGQRLRDMIRDMDTIARVGGDEFVIFQSGDCSPASIHQICIRLIDGLAEPFLVESRAVSVGVSIGVACAPMDGTDVALLLRRADEAMYQAKRAGRGRYQRWSASSPVDAFPSADLRPSVD